MTEEMEPEEEQSLKQQYGWLYDRLINIFFIHDPVGLAALGAPDDEYSPEVNKFLPHLEETQSPQTLSELLYNVFVLMFNEEMILPQRSMFDTIAKDVWDDYQIWKSEQI